MWGWWVCLWFFCGNSWCWWDSLIVWYCLWCLFFWRIGRYVLFGGILFEWGYWICWDCFVWFSGCDDRFVVIWWLCCLFGRWFCLRGFRIGDCWVLGNYWRCCECWWVGVCFRVVLERLLVVLWMCWFLDSVLCCCCFFVDINWWLVRCWDLLLVWRVIWGVWFVFVGCWCFCCWWCFCWICCGLLLLLLVVWRVG